MKNVLLKPKLMVLKHYLLVLLVFFGSYNMAFANNTTQEVLATECNLELKNVAFKTALNNLEAQASIMFVYSTNYVNDAKLISYKAEKKALKEVLEEILTPLELSYSIRGNQIMLRKVEKVKVLKPASEAKGFINGIIVDEQSNEALAFATIGIKGTNKAAVSDINGRFRISGIDEGQITLVANFVGYKSQEKTVQVIGDGTVNVEFKMASTFSELDGVTVTGIRKGETKALTKMRSADNIKYVMSQEQMERFPDLTLSESLQRVPGVAVSYSYGLPRDIIIRGLSQDLSSVTVNGTRMPSTNAGGRNTDLNGVLSSTIESIEVIKTLTPDLDADGTGGTVNIVTKSPAKNETIFDARASIGYNALVDKQNYEAGFSYGKRNDKIGFLVGASYLRSWRGEDQVEKNYRTRTFNGVEYQLLSSLDTDGYMIKRDNLGLNAELNYFPNATSSFYIRATGNIYYEIQNRLERVYSIGTYSSPTQAENIRITQAGNWRDYNRDVTVLSAGGKTSLSAVDLDFDLTYSRGNYDQPIYYAANFVRNGLSAQMDFSNMRAPQFNFDQEDPFDPSKYTTNRYINRHDMSLDHDGQFTFNAKRGYKIGNAIGEVKAGGRFRYKYNDRSRNYFLHDLVSGNFVLSDYLSDYKKLDHFNNNYQLGNFPEAKLMEDYLNRNSNLFRDNENYTRQNTDPDSFEGTEYLGAAYIMTKLKLNKFEAVTGVRYEQTGFDYQGNQVNFDQDGNYVSTIPVNTSKTFDGLFPSLNLKYSPTDNTNVRMAVTRSLARPSYYDLVPWEEVLNRNRRVNRGNPALDQATSVNYDLLFEHYFQSVGLISGGVFHKSIRNYIYGQSTTEVGGIYDGWRVDQTVNGATATAQGFEVAWQQQLTFLPGVLNGLGIYANYTYVQSEFEVPGITSTRTVRLPDMRPHVGNVSLSYEKFGFSGRLSLYFYDTYTTDLADIEANDILQKGRSQLDFSASQRVSKNLSIYMGISNLTNAPISEVFGDGKPFDDMYYSSWGNIGVRFNAY